MRTGQGRAGESRAGQEGRKRGGRVSLTALTHFNSLPNQNSGILRVYIKVHSWSKPEYGDYT